MNKFMKEFKEFALKGNVMNMAVGVIIGGAFQGMVTSLTENIISPIIGLITQQNFDSLTLEFLGITLYYGAFITTVINFFIMAFVVFLLVKGINKLTAPKKEAAPAAPTTKTCPFCQSDISIKALRCPHCTSQLD